MQIKIDITIFHKQGDALHSFRKIVLYFLGLQLVVNQCDHLG